MGRWGGGEMGWWGDREIGRWGDGQEFENLEIGNSSFSPHYPH